MGSAEFAEWLAYERISPWGLERSDLRTAVMTAAIINTIRGIVGSQARPCRVEDVMLRFDGKKEVDEDVETEAAIALLMRTCGGVVGG